MLTLSRCKCSSGSVASGYVHVSNAPHYLLTNCWIVAALNSLTPQTHPQKQRAGKKNHLGTGINWEHGEIQDVIVLLIVQVRSQGEDTSFISDSSQRNLSDMESKTLVMETRMDSFAQVYSALFRPSPSAALRGTVFTWRQFCEDLWDQGNPALVSASVPQFSIERCGQWSQTSLHAGAGSGLFTEGAVPRASVNQRLL